MIEIQIRLDSCVKKNYNLTEDEYETLLRNFEGMKNSFKQQIRGYIESNLLELAELKEEIEEINKQKDK